MLKILYSVPLSFQSFMREKVFKKMPSPLRPGASFRRNQFRRTISKGEADSSAVTAAAVAVVGTTTTSVDVLQHQVEVSGGGDAGSPPPPRGIRVELLAGFSDIRT